MADVLLTNRARRDLDRLEPADRERVIRRLQEAAQAPLENARKLRDPKIGTFRYRVGDLRVVFDLDGSRVVVLRIGNRREIYR